MTASSTSAAEGLRRFDRTTSLWGPITMGAGLLVSLTAALYVVFWSGLGITGGELWTAAGAVLATFAIIAVIEPISYFPILGRSAMYQAFMIGNISNKLLPAAIVAQANLDEKPGSRRAELIAGSAIIGAVLVHLVTLVVLVGALGTWLVSVMPVELIAVARTYILPAVFGAVLLQVIVSMKAPRTTAIALGVGAAVTFVLVPLLPGLTYFATAIAVVATIVLAWLLRDRNGAAPTPTETTE
ncbi:hypothetical protein [Microbacterium marinilacus]|uniref:Uncharacterized protein n=1 Tax=Microbacterium marinilacus TaxID=415209 RepID=A0ABP7B7H4_9MICO|nr:hypothetical protein [Microbacterium marinilacus]MBY0687379.1 hypothetical protein [Microbacterium marinilacus]